jgi:hypothetical protein
MLAAICQAASLPAPAGIVELDRAMQAAILGEFHKLSAS